MGISKGAAERVSRTRQLSVAHSLRFRSVYALTGRVNGSWSCGTSVHASFHYFVPQRLSGERKSRTDSDTRLRGGLVVMPLRERSIHCQSLGGLKDKCNSCLHAAVPGPPI